MSNLRDNTESAARRALGATTVESGGIVIETLRKPQPIAIPRSGPIYTRSGYKAPPGKLLYEATGGCGVISVRASSVPVLFATDVAEPNGCTLRRRQGRIHSFFTNLSDADEQAEMLVRAGLAVRVVEARPYQGQPGDDE